MRTLFVLVAVMMALSIGAAHAEFYFAQDNFTLTFGATGQPGAAGGTFVSTGHIKDWNTNSSSVWFELTGVTNVGAQPVGTQYVTVYDDCVLTLYAGTTIGTTTTMLWQGGGWIDTHVNMDGSEFGVPDRPSYEGNPVSFRSLGEGAFAATFTTSTFAADAFRVDWLGSYNWSYDIADASGNPTSSATVQLGNVQGKLTAIPEASTVMLGFAGLSTLMGFRRLRRK